MNKTISTQKAGQVIDATHFLRVAGNPVKVFRIEGETNSTTGTDYYIQLLAVPFASAVSGTTVPLLSVLAVPAAYPSAKSGFSFIYPEGLDTSRMSYPASATVNGDNTSEVYVALSSTDVVWTAVAGATNLAITIEQFFVDLPNQTKLVTLASAQSIVWADLIANTNLRLINFTYNNTGGTDVYVQLSTFAPSLGTLSLMEWKCLANATINQSFGNGQTLMQNNALYVPHYGCYISTSDTPLTYTASASVPTSITSNTIAL